MRKLIFIIFLVVGYLIFRPILGDVWYPVHDTTSIARTYLLEKTLASGQIPAVWSAELNGGQGYPLFHFYAPLMAYLSLLGKTITGSYFIGIKIVLACFTIFGMVGMYLLTRRWGRAAGIIAALSFALLPYAALNLYVRGAYAEYLSMALLPWVFYVWRNLTTNRQKLIAGFVTALFLLSHNLIPLITAPFLLAWIIRNNSSKLTSLILPILLTLGLVSFYLIPLTFERGFVQVEAVATTTDYAKHFVAPSQLWNSQWGYGGSGEGIPDGMSFKVGKIQLILAAIATLAIITKRKKELFFPISLTVAVFMSTSYSAFIWQSLPLLPLVQFPWRYLALVGFFASILTGYSLTLISSKLLRFGCMLLAVGCLLFFNLKLFTPQTTFPADLNIYTSESYLSTLPSIIPEYRPIWLDIQNPTIPDAEILPHNYYPTWQVRVDGESVATYPGVGGQLAYSNPSRSLDVHANQSHTTIENFATLLSLISLVVAIKLYVKT